jgi:hypothetical protein
VTGNDVGREDPNVREWVSPPMMAHPDPRVPLIDPENIPEELRAELGPAFARSRQMWVTVPRYLRMSGHAPVAVEPRQLLDQKIRIDYLDRDYVKMALLTECNR